MAKKKAVSLSWEEKIKRIEQAPKEVQLMVAKAYIRDDIPDEQVQYLFNTLSLEEMNEEGVKIENVNQEEPEGIGASGFTMRTTMPYDNNNFITTGWGGWNTCIKGNPMQEHANVLANCVGYASGRFNEIINIARDQGGCTYTNLNCNAMYFVDRAADDGLAIGWSPRRGAIMCWGSGGAGHVEVVERVDSEGQVYTSASNYGGTAFYNATRNNGNGRWGLTSDFYFRGFIYLPDDVQKAIDGSPEPGPSSNFEIGDHVIVNGPLYYTANSNTAAGYANSVDTYVTRKVPGTAHPYNTTDDLGWCDESSMTKVTPPPTPTTESKGLDLSAWQEGISMDAVKNSEYNKFVILRGGFTGWGTGESLNKDKCFESFYADAKAKGIPVGAYWFSCANTYDKGVAEANYFYENCLKGKQFEFPVYIDVEDEHWQSGNPRGVTDAIKGFCETLEAKKFYVGIYASDISGFAEKMYIGELGQYDKWVARYGSAPQYVKEYGMWQTGSTGRISGYDENVDTNIAYKDYEKIIKESGLNGYGDQPTPPIPPAPPTPTPTLKYNIGDHVVLNGDLYVSSNAPTPSGWARDEVTYITRTAPGAAHPYNTTGDLGWMNEEDISYYDGSTLNVGDKVRIIGTGNGSSYGDSNVAYGIGWTRYILQIYGDRPYPYRVGDSSGTVGFYQASALEKK